MIKLYRYIKSHINPYEHPVIQHCARNWLDYIDIKLPNGYDRFIDYK